MAKLHGKAKKAFLARMARGRNKKHRSKTGHKARKRPSKGGHVAKRKSHRFRKAARKFRRKAHTAISRFLPDNDKLLGIGTAYAYGKIEAASRTDDKHFLKSVPALVPQIGRAGNAGALLWLAGVVSKHRVVKSVAAGVLHVAAYQNAAQPSGFTKESQDFKMSGPARGGRRDELLVENYLRRNG